MSAHGQQARWLAIVGIGEDGAEGLSPAARALIANAKLVIGGKRHLALADGLPSGERMPWPSPIAKSIPAILAHRGEPVAVLASGDPYCFGVGAMLSAHVPAEETICVPAPSSLSLACARLGWALDDVAAVSLCGRPIETLAPSLQPNRRVLVLSADAATPADVARYLSTRGFGRSKMHVLEALGGPRERMRLTTADRFGFNDVEALNLIAIEVEASPGAKIIPLVSGLPDDMFEHDGQITKREIRAVTLSSLAPARRRAAVGHRLRLRLHRHRVAAASPGEPRHRHRARSSARRPRRAQRRRAWRATAGDGDRRGSAHAR